MTYNGYSISLKNRTEEISVCDEIKYVNVITYFQNYVIHVIS